MVSDPQLIIGAAFFAFGLAFGSFLNVVIHRVPRRLSVVRPRSACPKCRRAIAWYDNIPVVSWLLLRGRCRGCTTRIAARYPLVELLTGLLFLGSFLAFGASAAAIKYSIFGFLLLGLIFIDAEHQLLPDAITLPGLGIGLGLSLLVPVNDFASLLFSEVSLPISSAISARLFSLGDALLGAAVGAGFIYGVGFLYLRARGIEGMGFGDVKLMAMVGAFIGTKLTLFTIFAGSLLGSIFGIALILGVWAKRTRRRMRTHREPAAAARRRAWRSATALYRHFPIPFGVFLGAAALIAVYFGPALMNWYLERYL
jgi:leader peptidase (prepilin peptidase)/N-methyltransferase